MTSDSISAPPPLAPHSLLKWVFFLSGGAGLMYEVSWTHQFANILGSTAGSMAVVFSVFLSFLALGGHLAGRSRAVLADPLLSYVALEVLIGLLGAGSAFAVLHYEPVLIGWLPGSGAGPAALPLHILAVAVVIGPASTAMGATLPVMTEGAKLWTLPSRAVSTLYGINTAGAAFGAILPGICSSPGSACRARPSPRQG
ncbi:MAG: hypothetical protein QM765_41435 [Myxococcales bacterium]